MVDGAGGVVWMVWWWRWSNREVGDGDGGGGGGRAAWIVGNGNGWICGGSCDGGGEETVLLEMEEM